MEIFSKIKYFRVVLLLSLIPLFSVSCTRQERSEIIIREIESETTYTQSTPDAYSEYRYVINKRSGKVHTYNHGIEIIENPDNILKTNENLEKILEDEKYDICLTCYAGLDLNLKKYKKKTNDSKTNKQIDEEIVLIEKYMRLYEFGQLDSETQKFLICIFEVGNWYVNNVYTQLGGQKSALEINSIAADNASENAYKRWRDYLDKEYYSKYELRTEKRILPVVYDGEKSTDMVTYRCYLFKNAGYGKGDSIYSKTGMQILKNAEGEEIDREWKNYCVVDDSSKFAAAVYYHYINKEILKDKDSDEKTAYDIDLWTTGTLDYSSKKSKMVNKLIKLSRKFEFFDKTKIIEENNKYLRGEIDDEFSLKVGDLIYKPKSKTTDGNVEFYIGNNKVVGWGHINKNYVTKKVFKQINNEFYSDYVEDNDVPYVSIIRFKGGQKNVKK